MASVSSITRSGTTATVIQTAHGYLTGDYARISGANETDYNLEIKNGARPVPITVIDANSYTYTVSGSPATPATGTITAVKYVIKTVKPSGGDYTSSAAFEAGEQRDLGLSDEIAAAECYSMSESSQLNISGWTAYALNFIHFYTLKSERHDGKWNATKHRMEVTDAECVVNSEDFVRFDGFQFKVVAPTSSLNAFSVSSVGAGSEFHFISNIIDGGGSTLMVGLYIFDSQLKAIVRTNMMYDCERSGSGNIEIASCGAGTVIENNTFVGGYRCIRCVDTDAVFTNNVAKGSTHGQDFYGVFGAASDYNNSSVGSATGGAHDKVNQTVAFVNEAGKDFHLASGDTSAKDAGTNLSAFFTTDIDGQTITGLWPMGADWPSTGGGGAALLKIIAETAQVSDGYVRRMAMTRPVSEAENLSEGVIRRGVLRRILSETINTAEGLLRRGALKRLLGETVSASEAVSRRGALTRIIAETQNLSETVVKSISTLIVKVINEGLQIAEAVAKRLGLTRAVAEGISISEGTTRRGALRRILNETASVVEGLLRRMSLVRIASETMSLVETAIKRSSLVRVVSGTLSIAEGALKYFGLVKVVNEGLNIIEGIIKKLGLDTLGVLGENLTLIFNSVRRGIKSMTTQRGIVSKTPKREVKP